MTHHEAKARAKAHRRAYRAIKCRRSYVKAAHRTYRRAAKAHGLTGGHRRH